MQLRKVFQNNTTAALFRRDASSGDQLFLSSCGTVAGLGVGGGGGGGGRKDFSFILHLCIPQTSQVYILLGIKQGTLHIEKCPLILCVHIHKGNLSQIIICWKKSSDLSSVCYSGRLQQHEDLQPSSSESSQSDLYERYVYICFVHL